MDTAPSAQQSDKERACAAVVTARGERWYIGPTVRSPSGKTYRGDIAIPGRKLVIEVRSSDEACKVHPGRLAAFARAGWEVALVHSPAELEDLLKRGDGMMGSGWENMPEVTKRLHAGLFPYFRSRVGMSDDDANIAVTYAVMCAFVRLGGQPVSKRDPSKGKFPHLFSKVPYLEIKGKSGSGKSTLAAVMRGYTGGYISGGITEAALRRVLNRNSGRAFIINEGGAMLRGPSKELFEKILLNGHSRNEGMLEIADRSTQHGTASYDVFGPKIIVSIRGVDTSALSRRIITVTMEKLSKREWRKHDRFMPHEKTMYRATRRWARRNFDRVSKAYEKWKRSTEFGLDDFSHTDVWAPMLATGEALGIDLTAMCAAHAQAFNDRLTIKLYDALSALLQMLHDGRYHLKDLKEQLQDKWGSKADHWNERAISLVLERSMGKRLKRDRRGTYIEIGHVPKKRRRATGKIARQRKRR